MKICKEKGCESKIHARGWCDMHYMRWLRYGNSLFVKVKMHGYSNHHLYKVWQDMKARCYNKNNKDYKYYGGKRITICDKWRNSPEAFIEWALPLWKEGLQIDRRDNDGNYEPSNCHFVTSKENKNNQRLLRSDNTSGFRGVNYHKQSKKWIARMMSDGIRKHLGYFNSAKEAALAYNSAIQDDRPKNILE